MVIFDFEGKETGTEHVAIATKIKVACFQCPPIIEPSLFC